MLDKQIIEVDYDKSLVEQYKNNYIMEEDGVGADEMGEIYGTQDIFNSDTVEDLLGEGAVIDEITKVD